MKYKGMRCLVCGCEDFYAVKRDNRVGCYCCKCCRWLKWLNKKDAKCFDNAGDLKIPVSENGGCINSSDIYGEVVL